MSDIPDEMIADFAMSRFNVRKNRREHVRRVVLEALKIKAEGLGRAAERRLNTLKLLDLKRMGERP